MIVPSKTTTVYILKHIMALSTMLLRVLMKCHRLYIKLEYYFFSVTVFRATFCCLFASTNQSKGTIAFFFFFFKNQSCLRNGRFNFTVTIDSTTRTLSTQINSHLLEIYMIEIYKIILMHYSVIFMHTILYNMLFKRDTPFLRHDNKKNIWGNYFASIYSFCQESKDYKCFAKMVSRLLKYFTQSHSE